MNKDLKLIIPNDSAWSRKTWRSYAPYWLRDFVDGIVNLIDWLPIIWKDRHWDDYYITKILQKKIRLQRNYLVKANRHEGIDRDNYWMTVVINLIEREHDSYYETEHYNFISEDLTFKPTELNPTIFTLETTVKWEKLDEYLALYPSSLRAVKKKYPNINDKRRLASYVSSHNQSKCRNLIFEILKQKSAYWWD